MYTDEDLDAAVKEGIFTEESVSMFRQRLSSLKDTPAVDEENFKLITGFNDIYVVIACLLLLFSSYWALQAFNITLAEFVFAVVSWGLAEFFVRKRKMALPAIVLLLSFVAGVYELGLHLFHALADASIAAAAALTVTATYLHWRRFRVPVTIAVGTAAAIVFLVYSLLAINSGLREWVSSIIFTCGIIAFVYAMYWDACDRTRTTHQSDVAFWLHLMSAPLIVHPVFSNLGILAGNESLFNIATVISLYLVMTLISLVIDRRAFMVSSLAYVLYALTSFLETYGFIGYGFAVTGVCIGAALLLLSAFWHPARTALLSVLPASIGKYVPVTTR